MDSDADVAQPSQASLLAIELKVKALPAPTFIRRADGVFVAEREG